MDIIIKSILRRRNKIEEVAQQAEKVRKHCLGRPLDAPRIFEIVV
jgi:hypothetical protein